MQTKIRILTIVLPLMVAGCTTTPPLGYGPEPSTFRYTPPESSGLLAFRAYPGPDDVCRVIGENSLTGDFLDDSALLIGCPKLEQGAIRDRVHDGARIVAHARDWTLLSMPN
ncbi:MAG: hypothetical protein NWS99_04930 [Paracoccaceae bacterium]|jgi:hypothetical protein|nr:hypothetical protein [Paracoccaceae bacterium]MDP5345459.1 hypothetical protein [Paracoccaceae bacterium]